MFVRTYVCTYVCMYVCMYYACIHVHMYMSVIYVCMHLMYVMCVFVPVYVCVYSTYVCIYQVCMKCMCVMYVGMHLYIYVRMCMYVIMYIYVLIYMYILYLCRYVYIFTSFSEQNTNLIYCFLILDLLFRFQSSIYGICGVQGNTGTGFPESFGVPLPVSFQQSSASIHSSITDPCSLICRQCLHTRHIQDMTSSKFHR
jgi:hypothetical protein